MADVFSVDSDGLDQGKNAFAEKEAELTRLANRMGALANSGTITAAAGNDDNGRAFISTHVQAVTDLHDGMKAWAAAVGGTKDMVGDMAESFRAVDESAAKAAAALRDNFADLAHAISGTAPVVSGGQGSSVATPQTYSGGTFSGGPSHKRPR